MSKLVDTIKKEALAAADELYEDVFGGKKRPRLAAALAVIFASEKKAEFKAWLEAKKPELRRAVVEKGSR